MALRLHPNQSQFAGGAGPQIDNTFVPSTDSFDPKIFLLASRGRREHPAQITARDCYLSRKLPRPDRRSSRDKRLADGARAATVNRDLAVLRRMAEARRKRSDYFAVVHFNEVEFLEEGKPAESHTSLPSKRRTLPESCRSPHSNLDRPAIGNAACDLIVEAARFEVGR